ncbi:hypothetical protein RN001_015080 [Aquatica leii]|uniref:G-protein coupled receptors family 2 profile 2 domain-containing protein n=1 Tax=Aquatica leii TaxID=1421715 RepID=A0AAN7P2V6_9COLE|nr:hypothetical protein RN001_015080 [Aquatica leii]
MRCLLFILNVCHFIHNNLGFYNATARQILDEDYYINYDYELSSNVSETINPKSDSLILPNPESMDSKYTVDILPKVDLPEDSLADTDLRDHDFIDNLMYVYYGSHNRNASSYGSEIIIIGSVLSCAAQLLTIFCVLLRKNLNGKKEMSKMFLHLMGCLCLSNLVFMLGVYATKSVVKCQIVALMLHYLHLLTAFWIFLYCYYIYKCFSHSSIPKLKYLFSTAYGIPALLSLISFLIAPRSYETKKFCFVSVQKGMLINYMLPISILIITTTVYSLNGIRKINLELSKLEMTSSAESLNMLKSETETEEKKAESLNDEVLSLKECKSCLKVLCVIQTSYDVVWFTAVLALENVNYSNSMPVFYSIFSLLLNWYIFAKSKAFLPTIIYCSESVDVDVRSLEHDKTSMSGLSVNLSRRSSSDNVPLLINNDLCTEMLELRHETISTISS